MPLLGLCLALNRFGLPDKVGRESRAVLIAGRSAEVLISSRSRPLVFRSVAAAEDRKARVAILPEGRPCTTVAFRSVLRVTEQ